MFIAPEQSVAVIIKKSHLLVVFMPFLLLGFLLFDGKIIIATATKIKPIILKIVTLAFVKMIENKTGIAHAKFTMVVLKETAPSLKEQT
jgi:hypothetical protein